MLSNDNRNRIFGASLIFAGIVGLIAPPALPSRACVLDALNRAGIHVTYAVSPMPPRPPHAPQVRVIRAHAMKPALPTL